MKRYHLIILLNVIIILILSSCGIFIPDNDLLTIVESDICKAPCWQGITPGVTTKDEVYIRILDLLSNKNQASKKSPTSIEQTGLNEGPWLTLIYKNLGVHVYIFGKDNVVEKISFFFISKGPRLNGIMKIVGTPEIIGVCHEIFEIRRELVYFENPISSILYTKQLQINGTSFTVDYFPNTRVEWITFRENPTYPSYDYTYPWTDFGQSSFNPENDDPDRPCPDYGK